jgi:hypothetical protein
MTTQTKKQETNEEYQLWVQKCNYTIAALCLIIAMSYSFWESSGFSWELVQRVIILWGMPVLAFLLAGWLAVDPENQAVGQNHGGGGAHVDDGDGGD